MPPLERVRDFRPSKVLVLKTLSCINPFCPSCAGSVTGCCPTCQVERLVLIEDLADNQVLAYAFVRLVHLEVEHRGYFVHPPVIPPGCANRQIRMDKTLLESFLSYYQDTYQGVGAALLLPPGAMPTLPRHQAVVSRLQYLVDLAGNSSQSTVYAVLIL